MPTKLRPTDFPEIVLGGSHHPFDRARAKLQEAEGLRLSGHLAEARAIAESLVTRHPTYLGALHTLGLIYADQKNLPLALGCLIRAAMLNPRYLPTLIALSGVYVELGALEMASQTLEQAAKLDPNDANNFATLGDIYRRQREYELGAEAFGRARELDRTLWAVDQGLADCLLHLGQYRDAAAAIERLLKRGPRSINPYFGLTEVPAGFIKTDFLAQLDRAVPDANQTMEDFQSSVHFVKAAVFDKLGRHADAWNNLLPANRLMLGAVQQAAKDSARYQKEVLDRVRSRPIRVRGGTPGTGKDAISLFILGPSRSGKTTAEHLISSLKDVKRGYENPIAENALKHALQVAGFLTSQEYEMLPKELEPQCREAYVGELKERAGAAKVFTNTHPGRIADVSRMTAILPNVRYVFVKRDLNDQVFRIYTKKYGQGFPFAYEIASIRAYVEWYNQLIDHYSKSLSEISRVIHYEQLVSDPAGARSLMTDLCGVDEQGSPLPTLGDDRGCSEPYRSFMQVELAG